MQSLWDAYILGYITYGTQYGVADKICDDSLNNFICNFDGGDCCHPNSDFGLCSECNCIWQTTNYPIITTPDSSKQ